MSKGKKPTSAGSGEKWGTEDVLQAIVVADGFNGRFEPITLEKARALLPLVNVPLIDYTLEFLARGGVREAFVVCQSHADQIHAHMKASKWTKKNSPLTVSIHSSDAFISTGDALRAIDAKSLIRNDFVLVTGDLVANAHLDAIVSAHKDRRRTEKDSVMTMVFKRARPGHRTRVSEDDCVIAVAPPTDRLLHLQRSSSSSSRSRRFALPLAIFDDREAVDVRYDLLDCHVSVCSPQVLEIFTDNFDYQDRDDFVRGLLVSEEISGNQIHAHVIGDEYASRVANLLAYDAVSKDVVNRWTYPLVPDRDADFGASRRNIYVHSSVSLARDCLLEKDVVVGAGSSVGGRGTSIVRSVIGRNCSIGAGVRLVDAYVWDDVVVGDDVIVDTAILCGGVRVDKGAKIGRGCIVSYNVAVGPHDDVAPATYLTTSSVGVPGRGCVWSGAESDVEDEAASVCRDVWGCAPLESDSHSDSDSLSSSRRRSPIPFDVDEEKMFYGDVLDSVRNGIAERVPVENLILEVNGSKHAYNIAILEVPKVVLRALLAGPARGDDDSPIQALALLNYLKEAFAYLAVLFHNYVKTMDSQIELISAAEEQAASNSVLGALFSKLLQMLYEEDVIEEDAIRKWYYGKSRIENHAEMKAKAQKFVQWLEEASSESN